MQYWLMKTEPSTFSIADLARAGKSMWEGVRNYQARNFMRDDMRIGERVLIYHSNTAEPGIVGEGEVCSKPYPDPTQFDSKSSYFDPKASKESPRWFLIDICYKETYPRTLTLKEVKDDSILKGMRIAQKGSRLSITPVTKKEYERVRKLLGA